MAKYDRKSKNLKTSIGSQLSNTNLKRLRELGRANESKIKAALHQQQTKTAANLRRRKIAPAPLIENTPPPRRKIDYWAFPPGMTPRPDDDLPATDIDTANIEHLLSLGAERTNSSHIDKLYVNLGIDFGTTYTKVIARFPYEPGSPTVAIPAPQPCCNPKTPHLWKTSLWLSNEGSISMLPVTNAIQFNTLKQDVVVASNDADFDGLTSRKRMVKEKLVVAYLAYVIRYVRGWLCNHRKQAFRNREPAWRINVGMPTEQFDDNKIAVAYRRISTAALLLADLGLPITLDSTELVLHDEEIVQAGRSFESAESYGVGVVPEAAAEMTAFAQSERSAPGLYMLIDVGGLTMDVSMFTLHSTSATAQPNRYSFMATRVGPLGVESYHWFKNHLNKSSSDFVCQCVLSCRDVVLVTKRFRDPAADRWKGGGSVPIFLVGGGANHNLHREVVEGLDPWMKQNFRNDGIRLIDPEIPKTLDTAGLDVDYNRMGVAWGLSFDLFAIGEIHPVSATDDVKPEVDNHWRDRYVDTSQV